IDLQLSAEEICNDRLPCGDPESLRKLILPRTPSRCWSGSTRTFKSYLVKVNASRSRACAHSALQTTQTIHLNFIPTSSAAASQFQTAPPPRRPKHSATAPARASESKPENRTSCLPNRGGPFPPRPAREHNPFCNPLRRS